MQVGELYNPKRIFTGIFIPESMVRLPNSVLSPGAKLLFGRLSWHASDEGDCFPSRDKLAEEIGVSLGSVKEYLRELETQGFIVPVRSGPKANSYDFPWHPILEASLRKSRRLPESPSEKSLMATRPPLDGYPGVFPSSYITEVLTEVSNTSISEKQPPGTTPEDVIRARRSGKGKPFGPGERKRIEEEWTPEISAMTVEEALAHFVAALERPSFPKPAKAAIGNRFQSSHPLRLNPKDWKNSPRTVAFRGLYDGVGCVSIDDDWTWAAPLIDELSEEDFVLACKNVLSVDPAYVKSPKNYIRSREFARPPKPKPKSELERMMGL